MSEIINTYEAVKALQEMKYNLEWEIVDTTKYNPPNSLIKKCWKILFFMAQTQQVKQNDLSDTTSASYKNISTIQ